MQFIKKLSAKPNPLIELINAQIEDFPYEHDGHRWCAMPQPIMAKALGISVETLRRRIRVPPIHRCCTQRNGVKVTLLRVDKADPAATRKQVQNRMCRVWYEQTERKHTRHDYGCFAGMIDRWGLEMAPDILKLVVSQWGRFMAGVHIEVEKIEGTKRFYEFPSARVILRFHRVAAEMWNDDQQQAHGMNADYAGGWVPTEKPAPSQVATGTP